MQFYQCSWLLLSSDKSAHSSDSSVRVTLAVAITYSSFIFWKEVSTVKGSFVLLKKAPSIRLTIFLSYSMNGRVAPSSENSAILIQFQINSWRNKRLGVIFYTNIGKRLRELTLVLSSILFFCSAMRKTPCNAFFISGQMWWWFPNKRAASSSKGSYKRWPCCPLPDQST